MSLHDLFETIKGGSGSGNFNHGGIPGHRGGSAPGGGGSLMKGIESIAGRDFDPGAAKKVGNRTSNLMNIRLGSTIKPSQKISELSEYFQKEGMKKFEGRSKDEIMFGNADQSKIVTVKKRSVKIGPKTHNSLLLELITEE